MLRRSTMSTSHHDSNSGALQALATGGNRMKLTDPSRHDGINTSDNMFSYYRRRIYDEPPFATFTLHNRPKDTRNSAPVHRLEISSSAASIMKILGPKEAGSLPKPIEKRNSESAVFQFRFRSAPVDPTQQPLSNDEEPLFLQSIPAQKKIDERLRMFTALNSSPLPSSHECLGQDIVNASHLQRS